MIITNRYDNLMAQAKKLRNKIEKKNTNADVEIKELNTRIAQIKYNRDVYCRNINNKLKDITSLIENERTRIMKDAKGEN